MFKFNKDKAELLLGLIHRAYKNRTHLFRYVHASNGDAPQHKCIPEGVEKRSIIHQRFLFFASILTYHSQSEMGFEQSLELFRKKPNYFDNRLITVSIEEIQGSLKQVGFIYPNAAGVRWKKSGMTLFEKLSGNPLRIFKEDSIDNIIKRKNNKRGENLLPGLGPKLLSLLALFYEELRLMKYMKGAFPCDIHVQNQCMSLEIVEAKSKKISSSVLAEFLRRKISEFCHRENISALELSHAMWFLGNRVCTMCQRRGREEFLCPVVRYCGGRISTFLYRTKGKWDLREKEYPLFDGKNERR